jgi:hypothetical protein
MLLVFSHFLFCTLVRLQKFAQKQNGFFFEEKSIYLPQTLFHCFLICSQALLYMMQAVAEISSEVVSKATMQVFCVNILLNGILDLVLMCWICTLIYDVKVFDVIQLADKSIYFDIIQVETTESSDEADDDLSESILD